MHLQTAEINRFIIQLIWNSLDRVAAERLLKIRGSQSDQCLKQMRAGQLARSHTIQIWRIEQFATTAHSDQTEQSIGQAHFKEHFQKQMAKKSCQNFPSLQRHLRNQRGCCVNLIEFIFSRNKFVHFFLLLYHIKIKVYLNLKIKSKIIFP